MSIKKAIIILVILAILSGGGFYIYVRQKQTITYTTALVERGNIIQTVNETGTVKSEHELNLSFLNSGKIDKINHNVGDAIKKDTVLAQLDTTALSINKKEAEASLSLAQTSLSKLLAGAAREDVAVSWANLEQAKMSYQSSKNELEKIKAAVTENTSQAEKSLSDLQKKTPSDITTFEQSIISAETSLKNTKSTYQKSVDNNKQNALVTINDKVTIADNALNVIDNTISDEDTKDLISVKNLEYLTNTKIDYVSSLSLLGKVNISLETAKASKLDNDLTISLDDAFIALNQIYKTLANCYSALENTITSATKLTQTQLDALKTSIIAQQTLISTSITAVQTAQHNFDDSILSYFTNVSAMENSLTLAQAAYDNALKSAANAWSTARTNGQQQITAAESRVNAALETRRIAEAQYNKTIASADKYDISLSQARVSQAQAAIDSISKQLDNSLIKSPIDGTVTKINFKVGEQVAVGSPVFSILTDNNFEIEVLISEADIAKVLKDQKSQITLDAFGDEVKFSGKVVFIEPAETSIQGVVYYKVKIYFNTEKREVKSGMTANVTIITAEKNNILIIPNRAIIEKNGQGKFVRVLVNSQLQEKPVTVGLSGDEGAVEVLSGVNEGEAVVTFIKEN